MNELLKLEFRKLKRQKWFYIGLAIMIALLIIAAFLQKVIPNAFSGFIPDDPEQQEAMGLTPEDVAEMKEALNLDERGAFIIGASSAAMYTILSAIFVSVFVCEDYELQTVKNIFSRGYSRKSVFFSKAITVFVSCTVLFIIIHLAAALLAVLILGMKKLDTAIFKNLAVLYLVCMAFNALQLAVSSMIRKSGGSIAVCILAPLIISMLLSAIQSLLKFDSFTIANYWIESFLDPASRLETSGKRLAEIAIASGVYIALFTFLGNLFSGRAEV